MNRLLFDGGDGSGGWVKAINLDPQLQPAFLLAFESCNNADLILRSAVKRSMTLESVMNLMRTQGAPMAEIDALVGAQTAPQTSVVTPAPVQPDPASQVPGAKIGKVKKVKAANQTGKFWDTIKGYIPKLGRATAQQPADPANVTSTGKSANARWYWVGGIGTVILILVIAAAITLMQPGGSGDNNLQTFGQTGQGPGAVLGDSNTVTLVPAAPLSCSADSYMVYNRYPGANYLGTRPYKTPVMRDHVGVEFALQIYRVVPIKGLDNVLMVQQDGNVYFVPGDVFPATADNTVECLSSEEAGSFISANQILNPEPLTARVTSTSAWFPVLIVILLVMVAGAMFAVWVGGRLVEFLLMSSIIFLAVILTPSVALEGLGAFYLFGLVACIALGSRGEVEMIRAAMSRSSSAATVSGELGTIVKSVGRGFGIIGGIDWSSAAWWAGLYLAMGLVNPSLSPLHILFGSFIATLLLFLQIIFFFGLESYRRGTKGDWGGYAVGFLGLLYIFIFKLVSDMLMMYITSLLAGLVMLVILILIGLSNREEINKDRLPDSMFLFGAMVLVSLTVVILFL